MANSNDLGILENALAEKNISLWNNWVRAHFTLDEYRIFNRDTLPMLGYPVDLSGAELPRANLEGIILFGANLRGANLAGARLAAAQISETSFVQADLSRTVFIGATFTVVNLEQANFQNASLRNTTFERVNFARTDLMGAEIGRSVFIGEDLSAAQGLSAVKHQSPSSLDFDTLYRSGGNIPEVFLRGCGVPETMITFAKSLVGKPIQYYSAFISYSSQDEHFARRLHNDLQMNGVRVWFAPEDLKIGETIQDSIDRAIHVYDKLIIVLSQNSIDRAWVRHEFARAVEKENQRGKTVLFPIRLDDAVFETTEQWAYEIRKRHIGDFRNWTNPLLYQNAMNRLLRDLNANSTRT